MWLEHLLSGGQGFEKLPENIWWGACSALLPFFKTNTAVKSVGIAIGLFSLFTVDKQSRSSVG